MVPQLLYTTGSNLLQLATTSEQHKSTRIANNGLYGLRGHQGDLAQSLQDFRDYY